MTLLSNFLLPVSKILSLFLSLLFLSPRLLRLLLTFQVIPGLPSLVCKIQPHLLPSYLFLAPATPDPQFSEHHVPTLRFWLTLVPHLGMMFPVLLCMHYEPSLCQEPETGPREGHILKELLHNRGGHACDRCSLWRKEFSRRVAGLPIKCHAVYHVPLCSYTGRNFTQIPVLTQSTFW